MAVAAVIGAAGRMGSWFADFLNSNGYSVIVCDREKATARKLARRNGYKFMGDVTNAAELSQIVVLATPTLTTKSLLRRIEPHISKTTLLVEISSVKAPLKETLERLRRRGVAVLSIHPMFGHGTKHPAGRLIIVAQQPAKNREAAKFISLFKRRGAKIFQTDLANHDRVVAVTLALPHFVNFAMVNTMKASGMAPGQARDVGGTTFKLQLVVAEALYHERLSNEVSILADNRYALEVLDSFAEQVNRIRAEIKSGDSRKLLRDLKRGAGYVREDALFSSAYDRFNAAVEASNVNN
jgi:prephenate dehydrogenase